MDDLDNQRLNNLLRHKKYSKDEEVEFTGCLPYLMFLIITILLVFFLIKSSINK